MRTVITLVVIFLTSGSKAQLLEGLYCGKNNCYDILGVTRDASKSDIARSYRKLAKLYHPDLHKDEEKKALAEEQFKIVATAYEILKDEEQRTDYDYMLDNPDAYYAHYYRYYRRRVAPKVDVRIVLFVTISVISAVQYFSAKSRYSEAIKYFMTVPKYRNRALDIAKDEGLLNDKRQRGKSKTELKEEQERIIQNIIEDKMDIKGAYAKPTIYDILWLQLIFLPYTIVVFIIWHVKFFWKHTILKQDYNEEEKFYLIRKYMNMGQHKFDSIEDETKQKYLDMELWIKDKFNVWKLEEEENMKKQLAESNRYKQYRRWVKKNGVPRMTFDDS